MKRNVLQNVVLGGFLLLTLTAGAQAQTQAYAVRGSVLSEAGERPLAGVQVSMRGTSYGTLTNSAGEFLLQANVAPGEYTIVFDFIGRRSVRRDVTLGSATTVSMQPVYMAETAVELSEIVVTGAGAPTERRAVGNTIASVSSGEVNNSPGTSAVDVALQGKVTGAVISENSGQPGGGVSIRLRGTSSILGGAEPLIVVDGVLIDNSSEALISLGANAGRGGAALVNRLADISPQDIERIEVIKGAAAAALYGSKANNGVIQIFTKRGQQGAPRITLSQDVTVGQTPQKYDLNMASTAVFPDVVYGFAGAVGDPIDRVEWQDRLWQSAYGTNTHVSVSGGTEGTTYYMGGGYRTEDGILKGSSYEKTTARARISQIVGDYLEVTANGSFVQSTGNFVPEGEQTQGVLTTLIFTPTAWDPSFDENLGRYPYNPVLGANPFDVVENWEAIDDVTRFVGNVEATLSPVDALRVRYLFGIDDYRQENRYLRPPGSESAAFPGRIDNPVRLSRQMNHDVTLTHEYDLSGTMRLTTTAGTRYTEDRTEVIAASAEDLPPGQQLVGGATLITGQSLVELRTFGSFIQERLSLGNRLYVTGGVNYEASSAFGADERWQLFPRLSASYLLHEEPFFAESGLGDLLSTLRLRLAYGETGGQPPGAYDRFNNYFDVAYSGNPGLVASTLSGNPDLKPERQREIEGGVDLGVWDDRAQLEFTYYNQVTQDLVLNAPLPPSTGYQLQRQNIGELTNNGVEIALSTVNVSSDDFSWRSRLQFAANRNKVTELVTDADTLVFGYLNAVIKDQPVGVFYGGIYARNPDGSLALDANGIPFRARDTISVGNTPYAYRVIGDPNPDWTASLSNEFEIGPRVRASVLLDGRFGNDVANFTRRITEFFGVSDALEEEASGEKPSRYYGFNPNGRIQVYEEYIEDGSFVKLREIALSYMFDGGWVQRLGAESLTLRLAGRNLLTWTEYTGLDPEINLFSANTVARGVDFATTPVPRTFVFGVNLSF